MSAPTPTAYWTLTGAGLAAGAALCLAARWRPGRWVVAASRALAVLLVADVVAFTVIPAVEGRWSATTSLPLNLCDLAEVVAAAALWWPRRQRLAELAYCWGAAGATEALATPDLSLGWPHAEFVRFVAGHVALVVAAVLLPVGLRVVPAPGAVRRVFTTTLAYAVVVGGIDAALGADYMFLAHPPAHASLLSVLGPWPVYLLGAAVVALVLFTALCAPFTRRPRATPRSAPPLR